MPEPTRPHLDPDPDIMPLDPLAAQQPAGTPWLWIVVVLAVILAAVWWWRPNASQSPAEAVGRSTADDVRPTP